MSCFTKTIISCRYLSIMCSRYVIWRTASPNWSRTSITSYRAKKKTAARNEAVSASELSAASDLASPAAGKSALAVKWVDSPSILRVINRDRGTGHSSKMTSRSSIEEAALWVVNHKILTSSCIESLKNREGALSRTPRGWTASNFHPIQDYRGKVFMPCWIRIAHLPNKTKRCRLKRSRPRWRQVLTEARATWARTHRLEIIPSKRRCKPQLNRMRRKSVVRTLWWNKKKWQVLWLDLKQTSLKTLQLRLCRSQHPSARVWIHNRRMLSIKIDPLFITTNEICHIYSQQMLIS